MIKCLVPTIYLSFDIVFPFMPLSEPSLLSSQDYPFVFLQNPIK